MPGTDGGDRSAAELGTHTVDGLGLKNGDMLMLKYTASSGNEAAGQSISGKMGGSESIGISKVIDGSAAATPTKAGAKQSPLDDELDKDPGGPQHQTPLLPCLRGRAEREGEQEGGRVELHPAIEAVGLRHQQEVSCRPRAVAKGHLLQVPAVGNHIAASGVPHGGPRRVREQRHGEQLYQCVAAERRAAGRPATRPLLPLRQDTARY
ncbi:hypothetical protein PMKS-001036 [Pichia membranifaciens]|uniref:Uncharacterized protein n=1 Tax=Pichia membranifaciens TaxID=4926 RepID=A0A1Q2YDI9_9ASCO|nr:hypothetical protein PMKS-001036 [Pichia membranifaciens]